MKIKNKNNLVKFEIAMVVICLSYITISGSSNGAPTSNVAQIFAYIFGATGIIFGVIFGKELLWDIIRKPAEEKKTDIRVDNTHQEMRDQLEPSTYVDSKSSNKLKGNEKGSPIIRG